MFAEFWWKSFLVGDTCWKGVAFLFWLESFSFNQSTDQIQTPAIVAESKQCRVCIQMLENITLWPAYGAALGWVGGGF